MNAMDVLAMGSALVLMAGALMAKVCTARLMQRMQIQVETVGQSRQQALGRLKKAELQHSVLKRNLDQLSKKKAKLERRKGKLGKEMRQLHAQVNRRANVGIAA